MFLFRLFSIIICCIASQMASAQPSLQYSLDCSGGPGAAIIDVTAPVGGSWEYALDGQGFQGNSVFSGVLPGNHELVAQNGAGERDTVRVNTNCGLEPFPCQSCDPTGGFYQVFTENGRIASLDLERRQFDPLPNSPAGIHINAIGVNPSDSLAYGMRRRNSTELIVVDRTGRAVNLGPVNDLPQGDYGSGDFGPEGLLHIKNAFSTTVYKIQVETGRMVGSYVLSRQERSGDITFNPVNQRFYYMNEFGGVYSFAAEDAISELFFVGNTGLSGVMGALYSDLSGKVYGILNNNGNLYQIDTADASVQFIMRTGSSSFNDGFSCRNSYLQEVPKPEIRMSCSEIQGHLSFEITAPEGEGYEFSLDGSDFDTLRSYLDIPAGNHQIITRIAEACEPDTTNLELSPQHQTTATVTISNCEEWVAPSGRVFTESGSYRDTLLNSMGCDSILSIDLTIRESTESRQLVTECGAYVWNGTTYTTSGTYEYNTTNAAGCDSTAILELEILPAAATSISVSTCGSYRSPDGEEVWTSSGTYRDTLMAQNGCDSVITVDLSAGEIDADWRAVDPGCPEPEYTAIEILSLTHQPPHHMVLGSDTFALDALPASVEGQDTGRVGLQFLSADSCESAEYSVEIDRLERPQLELSGPERLHICDNRAEFSIEQSQAGRLEWTPSDWVHCDSCQTVVAEIPSSGVIRATLTAESGCTASDSVAVTLEGGEDIPFYIPNIFTPNGDGLNDNFTFYAPENRAGTVERMEVYDRWGTRVFQARELQPGLEEQGWDGRHRGRPMPPGVYAYRIAYRYCDGSLEEVTGTVTLVR